MFRRGTRTLALSCLWVFSAMAQTLPKGYAAPLPDQENAVIAENRKGAKPRTVAPGKGLSLEEKRKVRVFEEARKSVVYLDASTRIQAPTGDILQIPAGTGTGFVWDDLGHIVTNHHIVVIQDKQGRPLGDAETINVTLFNGRAYKARMIGRSLEYDLAVLQVFAPLKDLKILPLGTSKDLKIGQSVVAIGNPFGYLDQTMTSGIVSGLNRWLVTQFGSMVKGVVQTDAAINPGNSGGPLLDSSGRLIGMNTAIPNVTGASVGIGFAIPVDALNRVVPLLIARGNLQRPPLGFTSLSRLQAFQLYGIERGIVVETVERDSAAERAGLKGLKPQEDNKVPLMGDVILGFQGEPLDADVQLADRLDLLPPKTPLVFDVLREGKEIKITMRPWEEAPKTDNLSI